MIDLAGSSSSEDEVEEVEGSPTKVTEKWAPKPKVEPTVLIDKDTRMGVPNETPFVSGVEYVEDSLEGLRNVDVNTIIITITQFIILSSNTLIILPTIILIHTTIHTLFFTFTTILNHHLLINHISIHYIYLHPISITPSHISIHHHNTLYAITTNTYT